MSQEQEAIDALTGFGLSRNEAKALITLAKFGSMKANQLAQQAGIPRPEVYRILKRLEKLGVVRSRLERPKRFASMKPEQLVEQLLTLWRERVAKMEAEKERLVSTLESVANQGGIVEDVREGVNVLVGKRQVYGKKIELCRSAKSSIDYMVSSINLCRIPSEFINTLRNCSKRVKVRVISEINGTNLREAKLLSGFAELRHASRVSSYVLIIDNKQVVVGTAIDMAKWTLDREYHADIWTDSQGWVSLYGRFFEEMWNHSTSLEERIAELNKLKRKGISKVVGKGLP